MDLANLAFLAASRELIIGVQSAADQYKIANIFSISWGTPSS
jgi:hypothetical protein